MIPAVRLAGDCPECGAEIVVRKRKRDGARFVSCSSYPRCHFACDYDAALEPIYDELERLRAGRHDKRGDVNVARELRDILAFAHPDRWPGNDLATQVAARISALRERVLP